MPAVAPSRPYPPGGTPFGVSLGAGTLRGEVWGDGPVIYLVHGWAGTGGQLGSVVAPLVARGYRVVAFDGPSHGHSDAGPSGRRRSNGVEFSQALNAVATRYGSSAHAVLAHSMGAASTMLSLRFGHIGVQRLAFVAPMHDLRALLDQFSATLQLTTKSRRWLDATLEQWTGVSVDDLDLLRMARYAESAPLLVVHDRRDRRIAYEGSVALARDWPGATLISTDGLGHRRVLDDPDVVSAVVEFIDSAPPPPEGQRPRA